jgi:hypothetical protein
MIAEQMSPVSNEEICYAILIHSPFFNQIAPQKEKTTSETAFYVLHSIAK